MRHTTTQRNHRDAPASTASHSLKAISKRPSREGQTTRAIETVTAKVPSVGYLSLAIASMGVSAALVLFARRKELANFVGLWAPSILMMGLYNKVVKIEEEFKTQSSTSRGSKNVSRS